MSSSRAATSLQNGAPWDLHGISVALLRIAGRGVSRQVFGHAACDLLLELSGCDGVELWLEDGPLRYRMEADLEPASFRLSSLGPGQAPADSGGSLMAHVAASVATRFPERVSRTPRGSLLSAAAAPHATERGSVAAFPFQIDDNNDGVVVLKSHRAGIFDASLAERFEALADILGVAVHNRRAHAALIERVKELTCLYAIANEAEDPHRDWAETLAAVVELLPPAWHFPHLTSARIRIDELTAESTGFRESPKVLVGPIVVRGARRGAVEVFYSGPETGSSEDGAVEDEPFLLEEHELIQGVAHAVGGMLERRTAAIERSWLEQQIRHADRLSTIGQLAAGVAHELNEPLGNVLGFAQLAIKDADVTARARADLEKIVTASLHAREIIRKLMLFARQTPAKRSRVDLNRVVEDALYFLEARCAREGVQLLRALESPLPPVEADAGMLQQVLVNLVVNALQAMPGGGTLTVSTKASAGMTCLRVEDTGSGIPEEIRKTMFLPFVTTKEVGQGTGLGLSVVHGIVTAHRGEIAVESELGAGSSFEVRLPAMGEGSDGQAL